MKVKVRKKDKKVVVSPEGEGEERGEKVTAGSSGAAGEGGAGVGDGAGCVGGGDDGCCKEEGGENGQTVVVGVRMDAQSKELLTWALVKVAQPGDRVIALHVLPNSSSTERSNSCGNSCSLSSSSLVSLVKSFDSVLAVYGGFCNLKQIDLKLKVCRGSSLRKVLVREAKDFAASILILGVAKSSRGIGSSSTSIAKYCAKKLPKCCPVLAVNNGKIVFQREAPPSMGSSHATEHSKAKDHDYTSSENSKLTNTSDSISGPPAAAPKCEVGKKKNSSPPGPSLNGGGSVIGSTADDLSSSSSTSPEPKCSVCASLPEPTQGGSRSPCRQIKEDDALVPVAPVKKIEGTTSSLSLSVKELPESRPGWPLLRRTVRHERKPSTERSMISVVQWVMRLPTRYSVSAAIHPDRKPTKSEPNATLDLDSESGPIIPAETDVIRVEDLMKLPKVLECLHEKYSSNCRLFSYQELLNATSNFSAEKLIGKGGSSRVYKGCLPDGKELAVKILKQSEDALQEFVLEIEIITTLRHKNIISLYGFCFEQNYLILVYDFLPRGSLEENLHGMQGHKNSLSWAERYKVALGVSEALDYLHGAGSAQSVIHRDVKSSNILLSDDFEPQLSDFGLATWASSSSSHITCSDVAGTFGYLAPEYFMYGKVNEKVDVYAFGVVLLELLSGRKPINTECPKGQESLVMWAKPILQNGKVRQLLDPSLGDGDDNAQLDRMVLAATLCIRRAPQSRPRIALVLKLLQGDDYATEWAKLQVNASEECEGLDGDVACPRTNIQSHLNLALLDVEDDSGSISSTEHTVDYIMAHGSLEEYLQGRWSRSSSFA